MPLIFLLLLGSQSILVMFNFVILFLFFLFKHLVFIFRVREWELISLLKFIIVHLLRFLLNLLKSYIFKPTLNELAVYVIILFA